MRSCKELEQFWLRGQNKETIDWILYWESTKICGLWFLIKRKNCLENHISLRQFLYANKNRDPTLSREVNRFAVFHICKKPLCYDGFLSYQKTEIPITRNCKELEKFWLGKQNKKAED